jgi:hypothetical protein
MVMVIRGSTLKVQKPSTCAYMRAQSVMHRHTYIRNSANDGTWAMTVRYMGTENSPMPSEVVQHGASLCGRGIAES